MRKALAWFIWIVAVLTVYTCGYWYDVCHQAHWVPPPPRRVPTAVWRVEARYVGGERLIGMKWEWRKVY